MKQASNGRRPQILKLNYLSNPLLDPTQILHLHLKMLKVEYLGNLLDPNQI